MTETAYESFLRSKMVSTPERGIAIAAHDVNPLLKPHQAAIVRWALRKGNAAIFAAFGLGKTFMQLEIARLIQASAGGKFLIVAPLGVRQEFRRDAEKLGIGIHFVRRFEECQHDGIYLTNYETIRDSKMDPRKFTGCSLDEAAVLRGFGGTKTFREFMRVFENGQVRYKFVATATPSPNEYIELLAYAAFLDAMDVSQAKTRFFKRDSTKADNLTLHPHKEREFWLWVSSWAMFLQKPSDLGFSDEGYDLPEMEVHWHEIPSDSERPISKCEFCEGMIIWIAEDEEWQHVQTIKHGHQIPNAWHSGEASVSAPTTLNNELPEKIVGAQREWFSSDTRKAKETK